MSPGAAVTGDELADHVSASLVAHKRPRSVFLVDALPPDYAIVAPDWRGFGATVVPQQIDHFLFADYLLDLDYLLDQLSPQQPVDLVGHSMGGNIATQYAGLRPERIRVDQIAVVRQRQHADLAPRHQRLRPNPDGGLMNAPH